MNFLRTPVRKKFTRTSSTSVAREAQYCPASTVQRVTFRGFPVEAITFYEQLEADNSRAFWQANKGRYDELVKQPMLDLTDDLSEFGPFHLFRPHNDLRFSKNKPPYKIQQGAFGESEGGAGYYLQFSAQGVMAGAGYYAMAKPTSSPGSVPRSTADGIGAELGGLVADAARRRLPDRRDRRAEVGAARVPEGSPADRTAASQGAHRRRKSSARRRGSTRRRPASGSATRGSASRTCARWLDAHVGPSTLPPDERWS